MADLGFEVKEDTALSRRRFPAWLRPLLMLSVPLLLIVGGAWLYLAGRAHESTDNAYVQQDKVSIAPEVSGRIVEVDVHENMRVQEGQLLFRIDPQPYRIALRQAEAALAKARVEVDELGAEVTVADVDIATARSEIAFAKAEFDRQAELLNRGFTTRARYQAAQLALAKAREQMNTATSEARKARVALGSGAAASNRPAAVEAALAAREEAMLNLSRTEIRAPASGIVSQTDRLQVGAMLPAGLPTLSLVADGHSWVEANFKETQLRKMHTGQKATITIDAYGRALSGHVESIGAGTGSEFALLPAQNANGNWVKVTQRVPVRIAIDAKSDRPLIAGLSAEVSVDVRSKTAVN
ncbi:HlyD family secretion protein [Sphingosinicella microcystinivorans]|uniref:Membrane fusion protein (Multidrug efflux system) n=1 Tax=Sphingosinicella microcystinivorans TaxID=335406 RepID=A0AAD1D567_SPHMI|nr:HlyD family secretion protein [Sphingosinicella microcystinivorans]RKS90688.1 membrane fusion protein (multidrug efflux system) [Sphingosinicella microcystinivorans]BBE33602.1 membrane protein [Sphingosinicella microcystinivorans]